MFNLYKIKLWLNWASIRAHICTVAIALSFNSTWRVPREAFRYGGVAYGLLFTLAMVVVALPTALLQLSVGQLSQQDAVGIWRAVPFFKGVGYLRLLITFLGSVYTVTYLGITATIFFYSLNNSTPFWNSIHTFITLESNDTSSCVNSTLCVNETLLAPVQERPEHYIATALITTVLWVLFPIILFSPVKFMKKTFYAAVPVVLVLAVSVIACLGDKDEIGFIYDSADWVNFGQPEIWYSTIIQALWSAQIAGGYLITVGDTVYSCTDIHWTSGILVGVNVLFSWFGIVLWYAIGGSGVKDTSVLAVLQQSYELVEEKHLSTYWLLLIFAFLFSSGIITALTLLYPLYERFKRIGGHKWRYLALGSSLLGAGAALALLATGLPTLTVLDDTVVPIFISITTVLEICPFIFIYGWRILIEDIEFLVGRVITKYWMWGWCAAVGIIVSFTTWWLVSLLDSHWVEPAWAVGGLVAAASVSLAIVIIFATISVIRQVQYDVIGKLKSSFKPSRHWGPRDPITHYYWLARRREDIQLNQPRTMYHRRQLGQFSGNASFLNISNNNKRNTNIIPVDSKRRSKSDDWLYIYRRKNLAEVYDEHLYSKKRSKSLDLAVLLNLQVKNCGHGKEISIESSKVKSVDSVSVPDNNKYIKHM